MNSRPPEPANHPLEFAYGNLLGPIQVLIDYAETLHVRTTDLSLDHFLPDIEKLLQSTGTLLEHLDAELHPSKAHLPEDDHERCNYESHLRHLLRTPLNAIIGYSEILLEDCLDANEKRIIGELERLHAAALALLETISENIRFCKEDIKSTAENPGLAPGSHRSRRTPVTGSILIVDDNESNRELLTRYLLKRGHTVGEATNGTRALEQMRSQNFDLVLLDIMMPGISGFDVLEVIKNDDQLRMIPVIMISSSDNLKNVVHCIELGAEDYLLKPFNQVLLNARLNASLETKLFRDRELEILNQLRLEQKRSDQLLLNILPTSVADRLKKGEQTIADRFDDVTVLFSDLVGFTSISATISPDELVERLGIIFSAYDDLVGKYQLEKIKTIGDAYMVVGGLPETSEDHPLQIAALALEMKEVTQNLQAHHFNMRIGIHTGPVVAGIVGKTKFAYDLWGDTVNIASRMESTTAPGTIQISSTTQDRIQDAFTFGPPQVIDVKGKGPMDTFHLLGKETSSHTKTN